MPVASPAKGEVDEDGVGSYILNDYAGFWRLERLGLVQSISTEEARAIVSKFAPKGYYGGRSFIGQYFRITPSGMVVASLLK